MELTNMPIPYPVHNNKTPTFLVVSGKVTKTGFDYLKLLNVYSKALKRLNRSY